MTCEETGRKKKKLSFTFVREKGVLEKEIKVEVSNEGKERGVHQDTLRVFDTQVSSSF